MNRVVLGMVCASLMLLGGISPGISQAATWAESAFPIRSHDFGTVAVAAKTEFLFPVVNQSSFPMHLSSVRASCGCTTPTIQTNYLQPGQTGYIKAKFNTDTFRGKKGATVTVVIDQPQYAEVQLKVDGYIRSDMVLHPGSLEFGNVTQGEAVSKSTKVLYAGRSDWQIVDVKTNKPWLLPKVKETVRKGGTINYELAIEVRENAPEGYFQDEVVVVTNDRNKPYVPLRISGQVESVLTLSPQSIALGSLKPGEAVTTRLVLIGKQPFQIDSLTATGWKIDFDASGESKKMHVLRPQFTFMGDQSGPIKASLEIKTAGAESVTAKGTIHADIRGE
jgi:hypothetical protein